MDALNRVQKKFDDEISSQVTAIREQGIREAEKIKSDSNSRIEAENNALLKKLQENQRQTRAGMKAMLDMELRKGILSAKQECISKVFDEAIHKLSTLDNEQKARYIFNILEKEKLNTKDSLNNAVLLLPVGDEAVIPFIRQRIGNYLSIYASEKDILTGFRLRAGNVYYNFSYEEYIRTNREDLVSKAGKILFDV